MAEHVKKALFVYGEGGDEFIQRMLDKPFAVKVTAASIETFLSTPEEYLKVHQHVVVSGTLRTIKTILKLAVKHKFSVGIVPLLSQKRLNQKLN